MKKETNENKLEILKQEILNLQNAKECMERSISSQAFITFLRSVLLERKSPFE